MPLNEEMIDVQTFMSMLGIKSRTTFLKREKDEPDFPVAREWPPKSKSRGYKKSEAEKYVNGLMENAKPWVEVARNLTQSGSNGGLASR